MKKLLLLFVAITLIFTGSLLSKGQIKIIYQSNELGENDIWIMNLDGTDQIPLTAYNGKTDFSPHFSPTGKEILFGRYSGNQAQIIIMNVDGTNERIIWSADKTLRVYDWAGGDWILFATARRGGCRMDDIRRIRPDGTDEQIIITKKNDHATFSRTGDEIVYIYAPPCWTPRNEIWTVNIDGSNDRRLQGYDNKAEYMVSYANHSDHFLFFEAEKSYLPPKNIYRMNPDGSGKTRLTNMPYPSEAMVPVYTPDDNQIVFSYRDKGKPYRDGTNDIAIMNSDGTGMTFLTNTPYPINETSLDVAMVPPLNQTPVAICKDITIPADSQCRAFVTAEMMDGGSYDPDPGDEIQLTLDNPGPFAPGEHILTLTVTDSHGEKASCLSTVTVIDDQAPVIYSLTATPNTLWPVNHKMIPVQLTAQVGDNCDDNPLVEIVSVTSNEEVNNQGDGNTETDWEITGDLTLNLRAERSGSGLGRIYVITVKCSDSQGNSVTGEIMVRVPKSKKK